METSTRAQSEASTEKKYWEKPVYKLYTALLGAWKFVVGVALTQGFLVSFVVAGWVQRASQRTIQKQFWKMSGAGEGSCFCEFTACSTFHRGLGGWPNWLLENDRAWMRLKNRPFHWRGAVRAFTLSLWLNLKLGVQVVFNTFVLTIPGCALMLFSWYAGWQNSFNKGYEQAAVGPLTGVAGILAFIAAMYYVPMAQMRQASTGDWRSFYQFKLVWQIVRKKWLSTFLLAIFHAGLSVPVTILKTAPEFFPQINPALAKLAPAQALDFARLYFFSAAFVFLGSYLVLRLFAARIYARGLVECVQSGALPHDALAENEWETLHRLYLLGRRQRQPRHLFVRTVAWLGTRVGRFATGVALFFIWFGFIAQVYVSEFVKKTEYGRGWLNQPLVQLPWFSYIPSELREQGKATASQELGQSPQGQ